MRKGRRAKSRKPLNNGALKLHHQALKTLFRYVGDTCDVTPDWVNPTDAIRAKQSDAQTLEYSEAEVAKMFEITEALPEEFHRLRNRAIITVLLNSGGQVNIDR